VDWAKHTTVLAAVVAAAGLAISAWGTLKSAEVANDQLAQSRDDQTKEERAQAQAVTMWHDWNKNRVETVTVSNRSLAPVAVALWGVDGLETTRQVFTYLGVLPPCTRATFTGHQIDEATIPKVLDLWVGGLLFRDSAGVEWQRTSGGYLVKTKTRFPTTDLLGAGMMPRIPPVRDATRSPEQSCGSQ
jgi:hypothetical protein